MGLAQPFYIFYYYIEKEGEIMINLNSRKTKKIISTLIVILLILSMTVPVLLSLFR